MSRLVSIGFIWLGCAVAWVILGSTLLVRSGETSGALLEEVHALWGPPLELVPPSGGYTEMIPRPVKTTTRDAAGHDTEVVTVQEEAVRRAIDLTGSDLKIRLRMAQRQKGLLWFPTYDAEVSARYRFVNQSGRMRRIDFTLPLPTDHAIVDGFSVLDDEGTPLDVKIQGGAAAFSTLMKDGEARTFHVALRSRGTSRFAYAPAAGTGEVRDLRLIMDTDFAEVDFPAGTLSPTRHAAGAASWHGEWQFDRLIAGMGIAIELPQRVNPGPLASRITFFAPVGLLFFFFVVAVRAAARKEGDAFHALNYFMFGCAFFAFHLLFAYLVDHVSIAAALTLSSLTSIFLVVSYARVLVGWRFAIVETGIAQLLYLVLFSITFLWKGYTGLSITLGAIVTLFVMMQFTARRGLQTR